VGGDERESEEERARDGEDERSRKSDWDRKKDEEGREATATRETIISKKGGMAKMYETCFMARGFSSMYMETSCS
jgi:hypothetical protein